MAGKHSVECKWGFESLIAGKGLRRLKQDSKALTPQKVQKENITSRVRSTPAPRTPPKTKKPGYNKETTWRCADGRFLPIKSMTTEHLQNAIDYRRRKNMSQVWPLFMELKRRGARELYPFHEL